MNPNPRSNPFAEPLLIALLAVLLAMLILAVLVVWRMTAPGAKDVAEISMYAGLFSTFTAGLGALVQALSRDPATARMNAAASVTNAATLAAATPTAPPPVIVVPTPTPAPTEVTGPGGGPVQTEEAVT